MLATQEKEIIEAALRECQGGYPDRQERLQNWGSSIYPGIKNYVVEDQQIPLQKCNALEEHLAWAIAKSGTCCREFRQIAETPYT